MLPSTLAVRRFLTILTSLLLGGSDLAAADPFEVIAGVRQNPTSSSADLVVHPSGDFYYQASSLGVVVMAKTTDGAWRMEQIAAHQDGVEPDLRGHDLEMGPGGRFLYLLSGDFTRGQTLVTFSVESSSGRIEPTQSLAGNLGNDRPEELNQARSMAISPDGSRLVVASERGLVWVLTIDTDSGRLSFLRLHDFVDDPDWAIARREQALRFSADNRLYVLGDRQLAPFDWHSGTGDLTRPQQPISWQDLLPDEYPAPRLLDFLPAPDGQSAYLGFSSGSFSSGVAFLTLDDGGSSWTAGPSAQIRSAEAHFLPDFGRGVIWARGLSSDSDAEEPAEVTTFVSDGTERGLEEASRLTSLTCCASRIGQIALTPDGQSLLVPGFDGRAVGVIDVSQATALKVSDQQEEISGLLNVFDLLATADGRFVYTASFRENSVALFERVGDELIWRADFAERDLGLDSLRRAQDLYLSPDERFLYVRGDYYTSSPRYAPTTVLARDPATGLLTYVDHYMIGGSEALAFSKDGRHGYSSGSQSLQVFERLSDSGRLREIPEAELEESNGPLVFEPNGEYLYGLGSSRVRRYLRNADNGFVRFVDSFEIDEIDRGFRLIFSPDGKFLHFVTQTGTTGYGRISVVERDLETDNHELIQSLNGLQTPLPFENRFFEDLSLDASGSRVFFGGSSGVGSMERDPQTGLLNPRIGFERNRGSRSTLVRTVSGGGELYAYYPDLGELEILRPKCRPELGACMDENRFQLDVQWRDASGAEGRATEVVGSADDSKLMWFFSEDNWEFLVKILDGCDLNDHYWLFASAATDVEYTLTVTEVSTGKTVRHVHELGSPAGAITDTEALAVCP